MNAQEIKEKYFVDVFVNGKFVEKPTPYYLINGKKSDHNDLISFAKQYGIPTTGRNGGAIAVAKSWVENGVGYNGSKKFKPSQEQIAKAKSFLAAVKGPFKEKT